MKLTSRYKPPPVPTYTCHDCGMPTTLPFIPRPNTSVTCTACFTKRRQPTGRREPIHELLMTKPEDRMYKAGLSWRWKPR